MADRVAVSAGRTRRHRERRGAIVGRSSLASSIARAPLLVALAASAACGGGVRALDPKDTALPEETRQWIADAEDGVIAAKARVDFARAELVDVERWADVARSVELPGGDDAERALDALADARVELARRDLTYAERVRDLAEQKYVLANAERAVLHDLATYELEPIRRATDAARERAGEARARYNEQRDQLGEITAAWWEAYAAFLEQGGDATSYWIAGAEGFEVTAPETPPAPPAPDSAADAAPGSEPGAGDAPNGDAAAPSSGSQQPR